MFDRAEANWYDTVGGLMAYTETMRDFHILIAERRKVADNRPVLNTFIVAKRWYLDEFGQVAYLEGPRYYDDVAQKYITYEVDLPRVVTVDQFKSMLEPGSEWTYDFGGPQQLAPANVLCPHCRDTWSVENSGDVYHTYHEEAIEFSSISDRLPLNSSFPAVVSHLQQDLFSRWEPKLLVKNPKWVDLDLPAEGVSKYDKHRNEQGFAISQTEALTYHGVAKEYWPRLNFHFYKPTEGDTLYFNKHTYYHYACWLEHLAIKVRNEFQAAIERAGYKVFGNIRVENEYGSLEYRGPWFLFDTSLGYIRVGWRKRVIVLMYVGQKPDVETVNNGNHFDSYDSLTAALKQ